MGAEILFYPTAIGWASAQTDAVNQEQYQAWQTIQRSHAIANGVHVVAVNRSGQKTVCISGEVHLLPIRLARLFTNHPMTGKKLR